MSIISLHCSLCAKPFIWTDFLHFYHFVVCFVLQPGATSERDYESNLSVCLSVYLSVIFKENSKILVMNQAYSHFSQCILLFSVNITELKIKFLESLLHFITSWRYTELPLRGQSRKQIMHVVLPINDYDR